MKRKLSKMQEVLCKCDRPAALRTVRKDGPNVDREFYCCTAPDHGCGFFKWATGQKKRAEEIEEIESPPITPKMKRPKLQRHQAELPLQISSISNEKNEITIVIKIQKE
jgi:hypothetical protein